MPISILNAVYTLHSCNIAYKASLRLDQGTVKSVHLVVETTRVAQVVSSAVPSPKGRGNGATVDTFSTFREVLRSL